MPAPRIATLIATLPKGSASSLPRDAPDRRPIPGRPYTGRAAPAAVRGRAARRTEVARCRGATQELDAGDRARPRDVPAGVRHARPERGEREPRPLAPHRERRRLPDRPPDGRLPVRV